MSRSQWFAVAGALILVVGCCMPWVRITDPQLTISGINTTGTLYGVPAYNHFIFAIFILIGSFIPVIWVKRANPLFSALNLAWAIRNFVVIPACDGGVCPVKLCGIYLVLISSVILLLSTLFPPAPPIKQKDNDILNQP